MTAATLIAAILGLGLGPVEAAATTFGPSASDRGNPDDRLACHRLVPGSPERLSASTRAVANYRVPCGAVLRICAGAKCVEAPVLDRGPVRARECLDRVRDDPKCAIPGAIPDDLDLSYPVAVELGIADGTGRPTGECEEVRSASGRARGCRVTWRITRLSAGN